MLLEEIKKEFYNSIKERVGEKLTDDQIMEIVEKFNLEDGNIPQIMITSDPKEFEGNSRRRKDIFEHSWAGSTRSTTETEVLIGDYEPGIDDIYEYSQNGDTREPEETHEKSDFSIDQIQVAFVIRDYADHFNGNNINRYNESVQIYIPEEREYPENVSFKQMKGNAKSDLEKRNEQLTELEEEAERISKEEALQQKSGQYIGE